MNNNDFDKLLEKLYQQEKEAHAYLESLKKEKNEQKQKLNKVLL